MVELSRVYMKDPQILRKELEDGPVLIDPYRRVMIPLNHTAVDIWDLLDGEKAVGAITEEIMDRFEVDGKTAEKDVTGFLKELIKREMIR